MASVKIFSLVVKTLAKPIANGIKSQATQHEVFRDVCIGLAQRMHRAEAKLRMGLMNAEAGKVKPLNDTRAIQNGATALAEGFLLTVSIGLVLGEQIRSSRKGAKRRDDVDEQLGLLREEVEDLKASEEVRFKELNEKYQSEVEKNEKLEKVLTTVVDGLTKGGWFVGESKILPFLQPKEVPRIDASPV